MSMWLTLAKIQPALLKEARERPEVVRALFSDGDDSVLLPHGFRSGADSHGEDFRTLGDIAAGRAEAEEGEPGWTSVYPWLARATGHG